VALCGQKDYFLKNFVLIGAAGYVAPRHLQAIKETGNNLLAALDKHDSVGILDKYFPDAHFFTEFERFDRHCEKLRREGVAIDYVSVCSPNYLHDAHIRFGFRIDADVICEKPLVLNPWNIDALATLEKETKKKVYTLLQLRYHPAILALKKKLERVPGNRHQVELTYITPRGNWYLHSWKGDEDKSGGIVTNIGFHFFDLLIWLFGSVNDVQVDNYSPQLASGVLILENADVNWRLSIRREDLRDDENNCRRLILDEEEVEFSDGFDELHNLAYAEVIAGRGVQIEEMREVTELVHRIRQQQTNVLTDT
jgi:UDP-N-acetyl-2-amino-2-deoxyglucuronate dehydrogenase